MGPKEKLVEDTHAWPVDCIDASGWIPAYGTGGDPAIGRIENQLPMSRRHRSSCVHDSAEF
jgi:hypothetical protein